MPRFFFHVGNGAMTRDEDGVELPTLAAARVEAIKFAGMALAGEPWLLWDTRDFRIEVTDAAGLLLLTIVTTAIDAPSVGQADPVPRV